MALDVAECNIVNAGSKMVVFRNTQLAIGTRKLSFDPEIHARYGDVVGAETIFYGTVLRRSCVSRSRVVAKYV